MPVGEQYMQIMRPPSPALHCKWQSQRRTAAIWSDTQSFPELPLVVICIKKYAKNMQKKKKRKKVICIKKYAKKEEKKKGNMHAGRNICAAIEPGYSPNICYSRLICSSVCVQCRAWVNRCNLSAQYQLCNGHKRFKKDKNHTSTAFAF